MANARERVRRQSNAAWCTNAIKNAPQDMTASEAYALQHQRDDEAATAASAPPGPVAPAPSAAAPAPQRQVDPAALAIVAACTAAGRVELAAGFIARGLTVAEAKHELAIASWSAVLTAAQALL